MFNHAYDYTCLTCVWSNRDDCTSYEGSKNRLLNGNFCDCLDIYFMDTE